MNSTSNDESKRTMRVRATAITVAMLSFATSLVVGPAPASATEPGSVPPVADGNGQNTINTDSTMGVANVRPQLPGLAGGELIASIDISYTAPLSPDSFAGFEVADLPDGMELETAEPEATTTEAGWSCDTSKCSWVILGPKGELRPAPLDDGARVQGWIRFSVATNSPVVLDMPDPGSTGLDPEALEPPTMKVMATVDGRSTVSESDMATAEVPVFAMVAGTSELLTLNYRTKGAARVGEKVSIDVNLVNNGAVTSSNSIAVSNLLDEGLLLTSLKYSGDSWSCAATASSLGVCRFSRSLASGEISPTLTLTFEVAEGNSTVSESADGAGGDGTVDETNTEGQLVPAQGRFPLAGVVESPEGNVIQQVATSDLFFTVFEAGRPDLAITSVTPTTSIVAGEPITISTLVTSNYGPTKEQIDVHIGLKGAQFVSQKGALGDCSTSPDGVDCRMAPLKMGESKQIDVTILVPESIDDDKEVESASVGVTATTPLEIPETLNDNRLINTFPIGLAFSPTAVLQPAELDEDGRWREFNGATVQVAPEGETTFGFVVRNVGGKEFTESQTFEVEVAASDDVEIVGKGTGWTCDSRRVSATRASDAAAQSASQSVSALNAALDPSTAKNDFERQILQQVASQIPTKQLAERSNKKVNGIRCSYTTVGEFAVNTNTEALVVTVEPTADPVVPGDVWTATLVSSDQTPLEIPVVRRSLRPLAVPVMRSPEIRSGGTGVVELMVRNTGSGPLVDSLVILGSAPGIDFSSNDVDSSDWSCIDMGVAIGGVALCSPPEVGAGENSSVIDIPVNVRPGLDGEVSLQGVALDGRLSVSPASRVTATITVLPAVTVMAETVRSEVFDRTAGLDLLPAPTEVVLSANANGPANYTWRQLCVTAGEAGCTSTSPTAEIRQTGASSATALMPDVDAPTELAFEVLAESDGTSATSIVRFRVLPTPGLSAPSTTWETEAGLDPDLQPVSNPNVQSGPSRAPTRATVDPEPPSQDVIDSEISGAPSRIAAVRPVGALTVRANVDGTSTSVDAGGTTSFTAVSSGPASMTWRILGGSPSLTADPVIAEQVNVAGSSVSITVPLDVAQPGDVLLLAVTASADGRSATDGVVLTVAGGGEAIDLQVESVSRTRALTMTQGASRTLAIGGAEGANVSITGGDDSVVTATVDGATVTLDAVAPGSTSFVLHASTDSSSGSLTIPVSVVRRPQRIDFCSDPSDALMDELARVLGDGVDTSSWFGPTSLPCINGFALFSGTSTTIAGIEFSDVGGYVVPSGVAFTVGTGVAPDPYGSPVVELDSAGPFVPYRSSGVFGTASGSISTEVPEAVVVALDAVGGSSEGRFVVSDDEISGVNYEVTPLASAGDELETIVATGAVDAEGTLELELTPASIPNALGAIIEGTGLLTIPASGTPSLSVTGSLVAPIEVASGLTIDSGTFLYSDESLAGTGRVTLRLGDSTVSVDAAFEQSADTFSITVNGTIDSFPGISGIELANLSVGGSLAVDDISVSGSIRLAAGSVTLSSQSVSISDFAVEFGATCESGGECSFVGAMSGQASVAVGDSTVTASVEGSFDTSDGTWSLAGSVGSVPIVDGVELSAASLSIANSADGGLSIEASGELSIFDTVVAGSLVYSGDRVVLTAALAGVDPFGESGPSLVAGEIVYVDVASESFTWDPTGDDLDDLVGEVELVEGDFRIAALVSLPESITDIAESIGSSFALPDRIGLVGAYNVTSGAADLAVAATGGSIDVSGRFVRASSEDEWSWDVEFQSPEPFEIISRLQLTSLDVSIRNHDGSDDREIGDVRVVASGAGSLVVGDTTIAVAAELDFESTETFRVSLQGGIDTLEVIDGLSITGVSVGGSLSREGDLYSGSLTLAASDIVIAGGVVTLTDPSFELGVDCDASEDDTTCEFEVSASTGLALNLADRTFTGSIEGAYDSAEGTLNLVGTIDTIDFGGGVVLNGVTVDVSWSADDGFAVEADASATIFDVEVGASIEFSDDRTIVVFDLANLEIVPDTGLTVIAGTVVFVASATAPIVWAPANPVLAEHIGDCVNDTAIQAAADEATADEPDSREVPFEESSESSGTGESGTGETGTDETGTDSNEPDMSGSDEESAENPTCGITLESGSVYASAVVALPELFERVGEFTRGAVVLPTKVFMSGSMNISTGALDLSVSAVSDTFDLSGTIRRASSDDDWFWRVALAYTGEVSLVGDTIRFGDISFSVGNIGEEGEDLDAVGLRATGSLFIDLPGELNIDLGAELEFVDSDNWSVSVRQALGDPDQNDGMWELFPGLSLPAGEFTGSVAMENGSLEANLTLTQLAPWNVVNVGDTNITVSGLNVTIGVECEADSDECSPSFSLGGVIDATVLGTTLPQLTLAGGFEDSTWFFEVEVGEFEVIDGLTITGAKFRIEFGDVFAVEMSGSANIMDVDLTAYLRFSSDGVLFAAGASDWEMFEGGPIFEDLAFVWSTYATDYTLPGGTELAVGSGSLLLVAAIDTPESLEKAAPGLRFDPIVIDVGGILSGNVSLRFGLSLPANWWIFDVNGFGIRVSNLAMEIGLRNFEPTIAFNGTAVFKTPDNPAGVPITLKLAITPQTLSISVTLGIDPVTKAEMPWKNAFGIPGFNINYMAGEIGINWTTTPIPLPQFGVAMSVELPTFLRDLLGTESGVRIEAAFKFANEKSCIQMKVGQPAVPGQTSANLRKAVNLADVIVANYFEFTFAPLGCAVGDVQVPAGIRLGFAGRIAGISVIVQAAVDVERLEISAYVNIDAINLGPVRIEQTYLDLLLSATRPLDSHVYFSGGLAVDLPTGTAYANARVAIDLGSGQVAFRASMERLVLMPGVLEVRNLRAEGLISLSSLVFYMNANVDVSILGVTVQSQATLDIGSSGVNNMSMNFAAGLNMGPLSGNANFAFAYAKGGFPALSFNGALRVSGTDLASVSGTINTEQMSFVARANVAQIFNGEVQAKLILCNRGGVTITNKNGAQVVGQLGDFYASATLGVNLGVLQAQGDIKLGYSSSTTELPYVNPNCPNPQPTLTSSGAAAKLTQTLSSVVPSTTPAVTTTVRPAVTTTVGPTTTVRPAVTTTVGPTTTVRPSATTTTSTTVPRFDVPAQFGAPQYPASFTPLTLPSGATPVAPAGAVRPALPREFFFKINANGSLNLGTVVTGTANFVGNVDSSGNVAFSMSGNVSLAGFAQSSLSGTYSRQSDGKWDLQAQFTANVAGLATVAFNGYIRNQVGNGSDTSQVQYDLNGSAAVNYKILSGNASFRATNVGQAAGVYANLGFASGVAGVARLSGSMDLAFTRNRFYFNVQATLNSFIVNSTVWISGGTLTRNSQWVGRDPYNWNSGWPRFRNETRYRWFEEIVTYNDAEFWVWAQTTGSLFGITFQVTAQWQNNALAVRAVSPSNYDAGGWQYVYSMNWGLRTHCFWCHTDVGNHTWYYRAELNASNSNVTGRATVWKHWERNHQGSSDEYGELTLDWNRRELKGCVPIRIWPFEKPCVDLGWVLRIASIF